jgi:hypothetical protein
MAVGSGALPMLILLLRIVSCAAGLHEWDMTTPTKCFYEEMNEKVISVIDFWALSKQEGSPMLVEVTVSGASALQ